jgi:gamma-glutamyltranspeptidase/glutathione hydrolase
MCPIIVHDTKRGRTEVICGQGPAPAKATIAHYKSEGLEMVPGTGCSPPACPARSNPGCCCCATTAPCGCATCWNPRSPTPATAIRWSSARGHHPDRRKLFRKHWTTSAAVYLPNNEVPKPGTLFTNKQLSETYARILKEAESAGSDRVAQIERARKAWSHGFVAEAIDKFCRTQDVMDVSARRIAACSRPTTWRAGSRPSRRR